MTILNGWCNLWNASCCMIWWIMQKGDPKSIPAGVTFKWHHAGRGKRSFLWHTVWIGLCLTFQAAKLPTHSFLSVYVMYTFEECVPKDNPWTLLKGNRVLLLYWPFYSQLFLITWEFPTREGSSRNTWSQRPYVFELPLMRHHTACRKQ